MKNCRQIYPHKIVRPLNKAAINHNEILSDVISDLLRNSCRIAQFLADNLKRATAKNCLNHASMFPCEYCFAKGVRIVTKKMNNDTDKIKLHLSLVREKIAALENSNYNKNEMKTLKTVETELLSDLKKNDSKKSHIVWPHSTMKSEPRTNAEIMRIVEKIENNEPLSLEEKKGIVGRSPLTQIPNFNFVRDSPVDYMHAVCIGAVKRLLELTFAVGENRPRITKRKLSSPLDFNKLMLDTKVPHECSRRARELLFSVMKAAEFRNISLFYFPHVIACITPPAKERTLWLLLAYMLRACIVPNKEFQPIPLDHIDYCCDKYYLLYESLFGETNCTYNTHVVFAHLIEMRYHGPLTSTSTFEFESFYGEMRQSYIPGTKSPLKQIFQKILLKRSLAHHCCESEIFYSNYDTALECNTLIYCFVDLKHELYFIKSVEGNILKCQRIEVIPAKFSEVHQKLDWSKVGVFKEVKILVENIINIEKKKISGKVIRVQDYLITCPKSILREK